MKYLKKKSEYFPLTFLILDLPYAYKNFNNLHKTCLCFTSRSLFSCFFRSLFFRLFSSPFFRLSRSSSPPPFFFLIDISFLSLPAFFPPGIPSFFFYLPQFLFFHFFLSSIHISLIFLSTFDSSNSSN